MLRTLGTVTLLSLAAAIPVKEAAAQNPLGGAILGGATGAVIGGVAGGGRGAAIGAGVGAATGAIIAAEGQRRRGGYFWWRGAVTWNGLAAGFGFPRIIADKSLVHLSARQMSILSLADVRSRERRSAFGGKADISNTCCYVCF